jgi:hypothetical protein
MTAERRPAVAISDLMILTAAIALGMAVLRITIGASGGGYLRHVPSPHSHWTGPLGYHPPFYYFFILVNGVPQILVASICVIALSVKRSRRSAVGLSRRPGFIVCVAAVSAAIPATVARGLSIWIRRNDWYLSLWSLIVFDILPNAGFMVLGTWMALAIGGRGTSAGTLLDRFGLALGASLVFLLAADYCRMLLETAYLM